MLEVIMEHWFLLCSTLFGLVVLWIVAVLSKYLRLMLNIFRDTPPPLLIGPFDYKRLEGEHVRLRAFDGTSLRGMFLSQVMLPGSISGEQTDHDRPANGEANENYLNDQSRGVIIFCHEYGSDMYSCTRYCLPLLQAGFDVFTFDFRSHGQSGGLGGYEPHLWCTDKEVSDCLGALAYVQAELEDRNLHINIGLFGISRGAGAAVMAAAHKHSSSLVRAVLADSAFSTDTTIEWSMKKWAHIFAKVRFVYENHRPFFWQFLCRLLLLFAGIRFHCRFPSVRKALTRLKNTPIFFIHGMRDSHIRPEQAKILFGATGLPRYLWLVPKAKHNQSAVTEPGRYAKRTVAFFNKFLVGDNTSYTNTTKNHNNEERVFFSRDENRDIPDLATTLNESSNGGTKKNASAGIPSDRPVRRDRRSQTIQEVQKKTEPLSLEPK